MLKAWHTHGNTPHGGADFYPLLAEVGKDVIEGKRGGAAHTARACIAPLPRWHHGRFAVCAASMESPRAPYAGVHQENASADASRHL